MIAELCPATSLHKLKFQQTLHSGTIVSGTALFIMPCFVNQSRSLQGFHAGIKAFVAASRFRIIQKDDYPAAKAESSCYCYFFARPYSQNLFRSNDRLRSL